MRELGREKVGIRKPKNKTKHKAVLALSMRNLRLPRPNYLGRRQINKEIFRASSVPFMAKDRFYINHNWTVGRKFGADNMTD